MNKTIKGKVIFVTALVLFFFVVFSFIVSYLFYSNALTLSGGDTSEGHTQFFIIFSCAEIIVALIGVVLCGALAENFIAKPLQEMNRVISDVVYRPDNQKPDVTDYSEMNKHLKELEVSTGDEIEELYHNLQKFQMDVNEYILSVKEKDWESEHDNMTMLSNRIKFDRRKEEVYPFVDSIYIACLDIINLSIVNTKLSTQAGDSIISKVARELRRISCDTIHTYRLNEDNFLVVMCGYQEEEAIAMLTRWNERVGRLNRVTDSFDCRVVWGGSYGEGDFSVDDIFKRADAEMYCQKMILKNEIKSIS